MFDKLDYSMKMMAREIEGLEFVEGKYLLDPNDPKAFNSMEEIELYKELVKKSGIEFLKEEPEYSSNPFEELMKDWGEVA